MASTLSFRYRHHRQLYVSSCLFSTYRDYLLLNGILAFRIRLAWILGRAKVDRVGRSLGNDLYS